MSRKPHTWFTADTHFGHARVIDLCARPFRDEREMTSELVLRWNAVVQPGDTVWHLGDFAHRQDPERTSQIWHRLNGNKHLLKGNHDGPDTLDLPWSSVSHLHEIAVDGVRVVMCHYPLLEWRGFHRGAVHVFGHVHGRNPGVGRSCDVGVDCWDYRPVSLPEILNRIGDRS